MSLKTVHKIFNDVLDSANNLLKFRLVDSGGNNIDDGEGNINVKQSGSIVAIDSSGNITDDNLREYRGQSTDTKPTTNVPTYSTFLEMDTQNIFYFDGTDWQVF